MCFWTVGFFYCAGFRESSCTYSSRQFYARIFCAHGNGRDTWGARSMVETLMTILTVMVITSVPELMFMLTLWRLISTLTGNSMKWLPWWVGLWNLISFFQCWCNLMSLGVIFFLSARENSEHYECCCKWCWFMWIIECHFDNLGLNCCRGRTFQHHLCHLRLLDFRLICSERYY